MCKRILCLLLSVLLLFLLPLTALAEDTEETPETITISTNDKFLEFAESCRLDSYSQKLHVELKTNLDLTGTDFQGIPIFCGSFDGGGHTISGLSITGDGSVQGLFRYLTRGAVVKNLHVTGEVHPQGSRENIGAIAGSNAGTIQNCSFSGTISGGDRVGGLVGSNTVAGIIEDCRVSGEVYGNHFVGGIAGENQGVIRGCVNTARINTTPQQNSVEIADITLDNLMDSESANTVTDIGGIAGSSGGVIRECENRGDVGYKHMGYNIGGIAGSQMGYIVDCRNHNTVSGRKEAGGIVGQMEPVTKIEYSIDTLQILQGQLNSMSTLVSRASSHAQENASDMGWELMDLEDDVYDALDAIDQMLPDRENGIPDLDSVLAAQNAFNSAMSGIQNSMYSLEDSAYGMVSTLSSDMRAITKQLGAMQSTINNAAENLGGSVTDISDQDTPADIAGKVENCVNMGSVLADRNVGGIAGAMALENDLDPEEDIQITGDESLNFDSELRAVILNCENEGTVTVRKQNAGGIAGWMPMGLVKGSMNTGTLEGGGADYVGGIAGQSVGFLRECDAKCVINGASCVGGIAGSADIATGCRSMVKLSGTEKTGAVLGYAETTSKDEEAPIQDNCYTPIGADPGAIDGISYEGVAQPLSRSRFLEQENLSEVFRSFRVRFTFDDGKIQVYNVAPGTELRPEDIPQLPRRDGYTARWEGPEDLHITFDTEYTAVYTPLTAVIQSKDVNEEGKPVLLAEGAFTEEAWLTTGESTYLPQLQKGQTIVDSLTFMTSESASEITARYLLPEDTDSEACRVYLRAEEGDWAEVPFTVDGSYLVFASHPGRNHLALVQTQANGRLLPVAAAVLAAAAVILLLVRKAGKKKSSKEESK